MLNDTTEGEWAKIGSSLVLVRQASILVEIVSDLGLFLGFPYGRFARNLPAKILYEFFVFPEVDE
jgi:hypothetical protein